MIRRSPIRKVSRKLKRMRSSKEPYLVMPDGREICCPNKIGTDEYKRRIVVMAARQKYLCALCCLPLGMDATFEHQDGRGFNSSLRDDRTEIDGEWYNAATHTLCNGLKGSRRYHWIEGRFIPAVYASLEQWERAEAA